MTEDRSASFVELFFDLVFVFGITQVVAEPTFSTGQLASPFLLSGEPLDPIQTRFLDTQGNGNGAYDHNHYGNYHSYDWTTDKKVALIF